MRKIKINARRADPQTSWEAALSVRNIGYTQNAILSVVSRYGPVSDDDIYRHLLIQVSESGARTRRRELVDMGLIRDSGKRGKTASGRKTALWELVPDEEYVC